MDQARLRMPTDCRPLHRWLHAVVFAFHFRAKTAELTASGILKKTRPKKTFKALKDCGQKKNTKRKKNASRVVILPVETEGIDRLPCGSVNRSSPLILYSHLQRRLSNFGVFLFFTLL